MAGALTKVFEAELTAEQMRTLAGKARCKDASSKTELAYGTLLAVVQRGAAGYEALPVPARRSIDASAVCKREMERAKNALAVIDDANDDADADWAAMRHAMQQLPPAALLHIISEEMTAEQNVGWCGLLLHLELLLHLFPSLRPGLVVLSLLN